ncbi:MAG: UPF0147 family protein [Candidatus Undinarchaeales archaeon]|jgi:uncharacterized protein (UPF0147 family)|nr:UPF0147 family protein [Candidatus Undinarchaeales archaeon]
MNPGIINQVVETLSELFADDYVPQNVRARAQEVSSLLKNENEPIESRKNKALQHLEDMSVDTNIDMSTRTFIYRALSMVESLSGSGQK